MLAAFLYGKNDVRVEEAQTPRITQGEVLLRTKSSFVCGTDVRMLRNGHKGVSEQSPLVIGHELSGVIEKAGKDVDNYKEGMRVVVAPNMGCGACELCVNGNTHLCLNYCALGIHINGGFAEYVRIPAVAVRQGNVIEIPEGISFAEAALAEPLSCVYNAFTRCAIGPDDTVLVIGAGPIGIMHAKLAKLAGASKVIVNDVNQDRLAQCGEIDSFFSLVGGNGLKNKTMELTGGRGVDVCITACASEQAQIVSLELAAINGRIVFFGGLPKSNSQVPLDTNLIHYKQLIVTGATRASLSQFRKVISIIANGLLNVKDLTTATFNINQIQQAISNAERGIGLKNMIAFDH